MIPRPIAPATEPIATARGGEVGPPEVRIAPVAFPTSLGVIVVGEATPSTGSYLMRTPYTPLKRLGASSIDAKWPPGRVHALLPFSQHINTLTHKTDNHCS